MKQDIVICPGCASILTKRNNGCDFCGYEATTSKDEKYPFRIPPLIEILGGIEGMKQLDDVCPKFLVVVAKWGWQWSQTIPPMGD